MKCKLLIACLTLLLISGCVKDESNFIKGPEGKTYTSNILGVVLDEEGQPIKDVQVSFGGVNKMTDENGVYLFKNAEVSDQHSYIRLKKDGYFDGSRAFMTSRKSSIQLNNILLRKNFDKNFDSENGGTLKESNITLDFPSNAIVFESTGEPYSGQVNLALKYLDPSSETIYDEMPGNLTGLNTAQAEVVLTSYGMFAIEMQGSGGQKLQIASGKKVKISNKVPDGLLNKAPSTIPLWYFDEVLGYWREEGEAQLINDTYVGEVGHFSYWNYDVEFSSIVVNGKILNSIGEPLSGASVLLNLPGLPVTMHGKSNSAGTFAGMIPKDMVINIEIIIDQNNCKNTIYSDQIGPFSSDVTLSDIIIDEGTIDNFNSVVLTGEILNCNFTSVQNGYIKVTNSGNTITLIPFENGQVNETFMVCNDINVLTFEAIDMENIQSSSLISFNINNVINLGRVIACGTIPSYIEIKIPELSIDTILLNNIVQRNNVIVAVRGFLGDYFSPGYIEANISWELTTMGEITPGTFGISDAITGLRLFLPEFITTQDYTVIGNVMVTKGGKNSGDIIEGTYEMLATRAENNSKVNVTGYFHCAL